MAASCRTIDALRPSCFEYSVIGCQADCHGASRHAKPKAHRPCERCAPVPQLKTRSGVHPRVQGRVEGVKRHFHQSLRALNQLGWRGHARARLDFPLHHFSFSHTH